MGTVSVQFTNVNDAHDFHTGADEFVSLHYPGSVVVTCRRKVTIATEFAHLVLDDLIEDGVLDPTEHDYEVDD